MVEKKICMIGRDVQDSVHFFMSVDSDEYHVVVGGELNDVQDELNSVDAIVYYNPRDIEEAETFLNDLDECETPVLVITYQDSICNYVHDRGCETTNLTSFSEFQTKLDGITSETQPEEPNSLEM